MAATFALVQRPLGGCARKKVTFSVLLGEGQRLAVHMPEHQHSTILAIYHHCGQQSVCIKFRVELQPRFREDPS